MGQLTAVHSSQLIVRTLSKRSQKGRLVIGGLNVACALGRSGKTMRKREGDGATPIGTFPLRYALYRADKMRRPSTGLALKKIAPNAGWCDAPSHPRYNQFVSHPFPASAEKIWRNDQLYDVVVVIGHNDRPRTRSGGSAIFLHIARDGFKPTEGCVALRPCDMRKVLALLGPKTKIRICS
jgi:L,D-peptidoglycan transpeptidase YkuD (ErfK/YbiS/YcfS/YnhG family)